MKTITNLCSKCNLLPRYADLAICSRCYDKSLGARPREYKPIGNPNFGDANHDAAPNMPERFPSELLPELTPEQSRKFCEKVVGCYALILERKRSGELYEEIKIGDYPLTTGN